MGNVIENIPIVNVINDIFSSDSSNQNRPVKQIEPYPTSTPIIFRPKPDPSAPRPTYTNTGTDQSKKINQDTLVYIVGGVIIFIILLKK